MELWIVGVKAFLAQQVKHLPIKIYSLLTLTHILIYLSYLFSVVFLVHVHGESTTSLGSTQEENHRSLLFLLEKKQYEFKNMFKNLDDPSCVDSSRGWLVILDKNAEPLLFNPFCGARVELPSFTSSNDKSYFVRLRKNFISKAVLPDQTWTQLSPFKRYSDVIFSEKTLLALAHDGSVQQWDFREEKPVKVLDLKPLKERDNEEIRNFPRDKFSVHCYLVESMGELLFVKRFIGNFVNQDGVAIYEGDLLSSKDTHPLVCPCRTMQFSVYKLDLERVKWVKIESLNDQVLFVGGNESISVSAKGFPECEANSIYFTDDRCEEMEDFLYGGHDIGVFNVQDRSFKPLISSRMDKIDPAPFWIAPT